MKLPMEVICAFFDGISDSGKPEKKLLQLLELTHLLIIQFGLMSGTHFYYTLNILELRGT